MASSSSGLGRRPLKAEIVGSNPIEATKCSACNFGCRLFCFLASKYELRKSESQAILTLRVIPGPTLNCPMGARQTSQARFCPMAHFSHSPTLLNFPTMRMPRPSRPTQSTTQKSSRETENKNPGFLQLFCDCGLLRDSRMPITLQKRSNILCLAVHFRLLGADKDPQSKKSCKKSEIFVFATGRSLRQAPKDARVEEAQRGVPGIDKRFADGLESSESTGGVATTVRIHREGKRAAPTKQAGKTTRANKANRAESAKGTGSWQRQRGRTRETHTSPSEGKRDPTKTHTAPSNGNGANLTKEGCDNGGPQGKTRGPQYRYGVQDKEGSAETSRRTLPKR